MPFAIEQKLVVAVASSALFDVSEEEEIYRTGGEDEYRRYQREHENDQLKPGVAFPFVRRLLSFNRAPDDAPVEVILLSRNDYDTGLRVFNSIAAHDLEITRAAFLYGKPPFQYIPAFNASLFLSANEGDVKDAIEAGYPAGLVLDSAIDEDADNDLRVAFDFDGIVADDAAEQVFQAEGKDAFDRSETEQARTPHRSGPLQALFVRLARLQEIEKARASSSPGYESRLKVAIVTSRAAPAHKRVVTSLRYWGITVDYAFFLGGMDKSRILTVFRPHIFFDDQVAHLHRARNIAPCVHVPVVRSLSGEDDEQPGEDVK